MRSSIILFFLFGALQALAQDTLAYWNFDNSSASPTKGVGTIGLVGGVAFSSYAGGNPSAGKGYNTNTYPAQLQNDKTAGISLQVSTLGYENIVLSYDHRHSNTAANKEVMLLSLDGGHAFAPLDSFMATAGDTWYARSVQVPASNQAVVVLKIVSAFADPTGYKASSPTASYAAAGTWRFDNIKIVGAPITVKKPKVAVVLSSDTASEQNKTLLNLNFKLSDTLSHDLAIKLAVSGTSIDSNDYSLPMGDTVWIGAGLLEATLKIQILDDTLKEGKEQMRISVSSVDTSIALLDYQAVVTIADNDKPADKISAIQGSGFQSPLLNEEVVVEAIVIYASQGLNGFGGFFIQEEDSDRDTSELTSEGLWVSSQTLVALGDKVKIEGKVAELFGLTQLSNATVRVLSHGNALPSLTEISLPSNELESYENMYVKVVSRMTVTENYNLGRYGELTLSAGGRLYTPSQLLDLNDEDPAGNTFEGNGQLADLLALKSSNTKRRLILDDGSDQELPNPIPFLGPEKTIRSGSYTDSIIGVLHYDFGNYRVNTTEPIHWVYANRPLSPPAVGEQANVKVASFNVENLFNGQDGDFSGSRGATSEAEFQRQLSKVSRAIVKIDADVVGLIELENDGYGPQAAIKVLVDSVNALSSQRKYAFVRATSGATKLAEGGRLGTDAIKVALIYDSLQVGLLGAYLVDDDTMVHNRVPLAQRFQLRANGASFIAVVNHFKSKGCTGARGLDADQNDGQSCFNARRKLQADSLCSFIRKIKAELQEENVLVLGDLNAYAQEDPMDLLRSNDLVDLSASDSSYSYVYMAESGSLDHALASPSLAQKLTGAAKWHINSDEPVVGGYAFNDPASHKAKTMDLYEKSPFRTSDHDPIILGFYLEGVVVGQEDAISSASLLKLYPNPVANILSVEVSDLQLGNQLQVFNAMGLLVMEKLLEHRVAKLDLFALPRGFYVLRCGEGCKKVYKQ